MIEIQNGVTYIGKEAFAGCIELNYINIPQSVKQIGEYAFYGCSKLSEINLPLQLTELSKRLFYGCKSLSYLDIPSNVKNISECVIGDTNIQSINISSAVENIEVGAFANEALESITVHPKNKRYFSKDGVLYKKELRGPNVLFTYPISKKGKSFKIPQDLNVTQIQVEAFNKVKYLEEFDGSNCITRIRKNGFKGCFKLKSIKGMENLETIEEYGICECPSLTSIEYSKKMDYFDAEAIRYCGNLQVIYVKLFCKVKNAKNIKYKIKRKLF